MKVLIYRRLTKLEKVLSILRKERSSVAVKLYVIIDMRENLLALALLIYLAGISLWAKFLFFQNDSNLFLLLNINKAKIKEEIEFYVGKLRLMWHFRNDRREFDVNPFKKKSKFNPKGCAAIEMYLTRLEEEILSLDEKMSYSNLTKGERNALHFLHDDPSIIIKEADKGSAVVVWDREDYLKAANSQLSDKDVYQEVKGDAEGPLKSVLRKTRNRGDTGDKTLDYFVANNPKLGRFYLLPKIHKRLHNVPGRQVISNSSYFTENISSLDFHLKP